MTWCVLCGSRYVILLLSSPRPTSSTTLSSSCYTMTPPSAKPIFKVRLRGSSLLTSPRWNKGTAFTAAERHRFGLTARLPYAVDTLDQQCQRAYDQLRVHENDIRKNGFLQSLKAQNWVLYYAFIGKYLKELVPIIYTPTEVSAKVNSGVADAYAHQRFIESCRQMRSRSIRICSAGVKGLTLLSPIKIPSKRIFSNRPMDGTSTSLYAQTQKLFSGLEIRASVYVTSSLSIHICYNKNTSRALA